jgi:ribosomal protein L11 methyltransferase
VSKPNARGTLWKVSVNIASEAEDAVVDALTRIFGQPATIYSDLEKGVVVASIFVAKMDSRQRQELREALVDIRAAGLNLGLGRISARRIPRENWAESWKRHFTPIEVSSRLLVVPSWSKAKPKPGQALVILDPGLSFGTGHHPTTGFCLKQIAALRQPGRSQSLLDIGAGSGILSIAALKLGYEPVEAMDFDPEAVRVAKGNARVNGVRLAVAQRDLTRLPVPAASHFTVICANLICDLLIMERRRILNRLARGGTLVLAGILKEQFGSVRKSYEGEGMVMTAQRVAGEWQSGAFRFG